MDTSAFDVDAAGDFNLNLAELYHDLPEDVQNTIDTILCLARSLTKVGLLIAAWTCCALAFCLLIVWICLYWLIVHLLLCLTTVLTFTFEVADDSSSDAAGGSGNLTQSSESRESKPDQDAATNGSLKSLGNTSTPHTSADLDLFEAFLNSPRNSAPPETETQEAIPQASTPSQAEGGQIEHEHSLLGEEDDLQGPLAQDEHESPEECEALKSNELSRDQAMSNSVKKIQLPFEPQLTGTAEQLKEAASLHAQFTKGGSSKRHSDKSASHASVIQRRIGSAKAHATNGAIRSRSQLDSTTTLLSTIPMLTYNIESHDTQKPKDTTPHKARTLPPHLRSKANAQKRGESVRQADDEYSTTTLGGREIALHMTEAPPTPSQEVPETRQALPNESIPEAHIDSCDSTRKDSPDRGPSKPLSFADVLKMDQGELSKKLTSITGEGREHTAVRDRLSEPAPLIVKPAERAMSIEHMKKLNNAKRDEEDGSQRSQNIDPNALEKIERLARATRTQAGHEGIPMEGPRKMKAMQKRIQKITMLESELSPTHVDLARCIASEKAIQLQQAAEERVRAADEHGRAVKTTPLERHRRAVVALAKASHQDDINDKDTQEAADLDIAERCVSNSPADATNFSTSRTPSYPEHPIPLSKQPTPKPGSNQSVNGDEDEQSHESGCEDLAPVISELPTNRNTAESPFTSSDQAAARTVEADRAGFNPATLPTFGSISSSESPTRQDALREVVEAINKQVPDEVAPSGINDAMLSVFDDRNSSETSQSGDALGQVVEVVKEQVSGQHEHSTGGHHIDQPTKLDDASNEPETTEDAPNHNEHSPNSLDANPDGILSSSPPCKESIRVKLPNSLSPRAPAFQPTFKPKESTVTNATKHSTLRASSNTFVPSANGNSQGHSAAGISELLPGDGLTTLDADIYTLCPTYPNEIFTNADHVSISVHQTVPPTSQLVPQVGNVGFEELRVSQLRQLTEATWATVATPTSNGHSSGYDFRSISNSSFGRLPDRVQTEASTRRSTSHNSSIAPTSDLVAGSAAASLSEPPGLLKRDGFNQQAFDELLDESLPSNGPRPTTPSPPAGGTSAVSTNEDVKPDTKVVEAQVAPKKLESAADTTSAHRYLNMVEKCFRDRPDIYEEFLYTSKDAANGAVGWADAIDRIRKLFAGHADLIRGFDEFVPAKYSNTVARTGSTPTLAHLESGREDIQHTREGGSELGENASVEEADDGTRSASSRDGKDSALGKQLCVSTIKKKKRRARESLREAASEREMIRRRVLGTHTLEGIESLQTATDAYLARRTELERCMNSGKLNDNDTAAFPVLRSNDLSAPKKGEFANTIPSKGQKNSKAKAPSSMENAHPTAPTAQLSMNQSVPPLVTHAELEIIIKEALDARDKYIDALEYLERPPPQNAGNLHDARKPYEARIQAATKRYHNKINAVKALFPDGELPAEIEEVLEIYDDQDEKELRDVTLGGGIAKRSPRYVSRRKKRSAPQMLRK